MKTLKKISLFSVLLIFCLSVFAEGKDKKKVVTTVIKVEGVCNMCKDRIENAVLVKGVKMATWDKETKKLQVVYQPQKTDELTIHKAVANAGHDTEKVKAPDKVYAKINHCCKYREGQETH